ncbi:prostate and testis expressed protein 14-like [Chionomys nivalis]|uniref:prostate and testis expressed protein 14-like n=1 Tax=Chionomys nivalis TaxID=269649 RepID=UPI0025948F48|nr:prostate and testis expressed protein 14-like [Chionomys nivalis]
MGKQLLPMLDFSLLLFFLPRKGLAEALMCFQCTVFHTKGICLYKEGSCETENDQTRVLWTASVGGRILHGFQECSNLCINQTFTERYITVKYTCCNNTSFCNQP